ncbi:hypothetical protein SK128_024689 [Halocaridina rubra]|uniref:GLTSCR protein conserved domain-containing protein n=1 Tax=Halocaridina rubra TaxID=373956 RepID=A0AAN8X2D1_HALRR
MPIISTSVPSPTVPTTSTTVTLCSNGGSQSCSTKMAPPPQCSPISSTTSGVYSSPSGLAPKSVSQPSQTSRFCSTASGQDHSPVQAKAQPSPYTGITKDQLFEHQLKTDQNGALNPDYRTPFKNKIDACKRLIRYHVYSDKGPTQRDLMDSDVQYDLQAECLLKKFSNMKYKYQSLLLKDSMRRHASSETVMLYRLFVQEEKSSIEREKNEVQLGKTLDLPPAPAHWVSGEQRPPDFPFPWELEWESQKIYLCSDWEEKEEEVEKQEEEELSSAAEFRLEEIMDFADGKVKVEEREEDIEDPEDSQEGDSQLHIIMGDEDEEADEEDKEENEDADKLERMGKDSRLHLSSLSNTLGLSESVAECHNASPSLDACVDNARNVENFIAGACDLKEKPKQEKEVSVCGSNNKSPKKCASSLLMPDVHQHYDIWRSSDNNDTRKDCESVHYSTVSASLSDVASRTTNSLSPKKIQTESPRDSQSLRILCDKPEKERRKEKNDRDKDKRKSDRCKERGRDKEKEDRPPKKLKIKLKHEERAVVPPLRIRTEDRGSGLKLTLKKQEGSEAYYSVGEERKREYRVEQNEDEEDDDYLEKLSRKHDGSGDGEDEEEEEEAEDEDDGDGHDLKEVKVVLQDVLKDRKFKFRKHDEERFSKRKKRDKSDDRRNKNSYHWSDQCPVYHDTGGERTSSQQANYDCRTWHHSSNAEWTRSADNLSWSRNLRDSDEWGRIATSSIGECRVEPRRVMNEASSSASRESNSNSSMSLREYIPPVVNYSEHYGQEFSNRQNHSQSYGHSGSQSRNSHSYH